ncbi:MAG: imidazole glycerol phosphate synthase subunit HisH [Armatimonadetes bacterium]|nr:imidazole glycerol phosphate synthase subunit HisH [Armatimonadota bacterium]
MRVALIDYGAGNLRSAHRALEATGAAPVVVSEPEGLRDAQAIVVPGVGAFPPAMAALSAAGLVEPLRAAAGSGIPLIGICLGMQLLFDRSEEGSGATGLGLLAGEVRRLPSGVKVPHMGWNTLRPRAEDPILLGLPELAHFYFVHSYVAAPADASVVVAEAFYGAWFPAIVRSGAVWGLQFHPEKSSRLGAQILHNLLAILTARRAG